MNLFRLRSQVSGLRSLVFALMLLLAGFAQAQISPQSTHDWTSTAPPPPPNPDAGLYILSDLDEMWADTKSPGDGRTYSVGTVEVRDTQTYTATVPPQGPEFSGQSVGLPPDIIGPPDFRLS